MCVFLFFSLLSDTYNNDLNVLTYFASVLALVISTFDWKDISGEEEGDSRPAYSKYFGRKRKDPCSLALLSPYLRNEIP